MTDAEKQQMFLLVTDESDTEIAEAYLDIAKGRIMTRAYPFVDDTSALSFPSKYDDLHVRLAVDMWAKRGAEGQSSHSENGVNRSYEPQSRLLAEVIPYVGFSDPEVS